MRNIFKKAAGLLTVLTQKKELSDDYLNGFKDCLKLLKSEYEKIPVNNLLLEKEQTQAELEKVSDKLLVANRKIDQLELALLKGIGGKHALIANRKDTTKRVAIILQVLQMANNSINDCDAKLEKIKNAMSIMFKQLTGYEFGEDFLEVYNEMKQKCKLTTVK